ncbi:MAG: carbohydrate porin [Thiogranum sp.]|jgi:porin
MIRFCISLTLLLATAMPAVAEKPEDPLIELRQVTPDAPGQWSEAWHPGSPEVDFGQGLIGMAAPDTLRSLGDMGIHPFGWWMISLQTNPVGGVQSGSTYAGLLDFGFDLDMEKAANVPGMSFHFSGSWTTGTNQSDYIGSYVPVNAVYSGDTLRFFEGYIEQKWAEDTWSVRAGRVSTGWEYGLDYDINTQYLSAAFRLNVFSLGANTVNFSLIPWSNWGVRLRHTPNASWRFQASVMNGYPRDFTNDDLHGLNIGFEPDEGTFLIAESTYQWSTSSSQLNASPGGRPGRVTFGGYYDTGTFDALNGSDNTSSGLWNIYTILRQRVWQPSAGSNRGIDAWTALTYGGNETITPVRYFWSGGAVWSGPFTGRDEDSIALGFGTSFFSPELASQTYETTLELAYSYNVNEGLRITPDLQYLIRPGGTGDIDNALILGVLLYLTF